MAALFLRPDPAGDVARRRLEQLTAQWRAPAAEAGAAKVESVESTAALEPEPAPQGVHPAPGRHAARPVPVRRRWSARAAESAPAGWTARLSAAHVGVLALLAAVVVGATAWWTLTHSPGPSSPMPVVVTSAPSTQAAPTETEMVPPSPSGTASAGSDVVVDVAGKVRRPGIVTLPPGSRVVDAIESAGGARPGVDLSSLNLARLLVDGEQVLVGYPPVTVGSTSTAAPGGLVNINTASMELLETLPDVGPVTAQAILDWRAENGSFTSVDELLEVDGIGDATLANLRDLVTV